MELRFWRSRVVWVCVSRNFPTSLHVWTSWPTKMGPIPEENNLFVLSLVPDGLSLSRKLLEHWVNFTPCKNRYRSSVRSVFPLNEQSEQTVFFVVGPCVHYSGEKTRKNPHCVVLLF